MSHKERVAAIVVTHNRKRLLKQCLGGIFGQSRPPDSITVMNNASTDGTEKMLEVYGDRISCVNLRENLGCGGGYYFGIEKALREGYDWFWLVDDDGYPDREQLQILLNESYRNELSASGPLVINKKDKSTLSFGLAGFGTVAAAKKNLLIYDFLNPYNGTLISRHVVQKIGNIKKEMFIWGDEREYELRMRRNGIRFATVTSAEHFHPVTQSRTVKLFGLIPVTLKPEKMMHIFVKNQGYINSRYSNLFVYVLVLMKYIAYGVSNLKFKWTWDMCAAYVAGTLNRY